MADDALVCPRDHEGSTIVRDGIQRKGGRARQRWRCTPLEGSYHRFLGVLSRTRTDYTSCVECENHLEPHQGPAAPASFEYLVREIADALVDVGRGSTYKDAAQRARGRANIGKSASWRKVTNGQSVMEWLADFTPVVAAQHKPTEWPAILVLDSIEFRWTDPRTKKSKRLFCILAAYGYDIDGKNGRLWKLEANPHRTSEVWADFLAMLPGKPESIVCDSDSAIQAGVDARWGRNAAVNLIHLCEHHLRMNALGAMESDGVQRDDDLKNVLHRKLRTAFTNAEDWEEFVSEIRQRPQLRLTNDWLTRIETRVGVQVRVRHQTPPIYSNGALEATLVNIRRTIASRAFAFRNRIRMNHLLELIRLAHMQVDNSTDYAASIRAHLVAAPAKFSRSYRDIYDPVSDVDTSGFCSLWSISTQKAMRAVRPEKQRAKSK